MSIMLYWNKKPAEKDVKEQTEIYIKSKRQNF